MSTKNNYTSNSLKRGLEILNLFNEGNDTLSLVEISEKLGVNRTTPYRLMYTLQESGYIEQSLKTKRYRLTPKVLELGYSYISSLKFPEIVQPYLEQLRNDINASCYLSILDGPEVVYIGTAAIKGYTAINVNIGTRLPAHATANGKLLLAYQPLDKIEKLMSDGIFKEFANQKFNSKETLLNELVLIKENGYAKTENELLDSVSSIAVPLFNRNLTVIAAINVVAPTALFEKDFLTNKALPKALKISNELNALQKALL
ncbi:hypothetical protein CSV71_16110 [Sporosarcina sp. P21c]|uniref:IclR family transcriptional regulator n=1 Tax=unclassified Sporosarcina TaxID=2647733 RepID=UPI000C171B83|nr:MULTISPECIES: IclR family transcriptional regulator [unclassified Sporosarcina]PIC65811.1 hypothetical protein CSV78_15810 [Sporosarcina sp. P16a]PIC87523.1 hypothetical protein CSV71_16110 [Sporosarcina sp. P21c]PIC91416.1 hypothetical protein CSV70_15790 [Sporosarcina sp. P25]